MNVCLKYIVVYGKVFFQSFEEGAYLETIRHSLKLLGEIKTYRMYLYQITCAQHRPNNKYVGM